MKKLLRFLLVFILLVLVGTAIYLPYSNSYKKKGKATLNGLSEKVEIIRDENNTPYIYANNLNDAIRAQGYVVAQDRLFQMQLTRLFAEGRIAELAGQDALALDTRMRAFGFARLAQQHVAKLDQETLDMLQTFTEGINQFIAESPDIPVEFSLAGIQPEAFDATACLSILYYMGWGSASNYKSEFLGQLLIDQLGYKKFMEIYPTNSNPDYPEELRKIGKYRPDSASVSGGLAQLAGKLPAEALAFLQWKPQLSWGSNNWVCGPQKSASGKPMLANDPHLDSRILPGPMYACGIITPKMRVVGVTVPGIPGILIGRNDYLATGLTNAYSDAQDLYIEMVNPDNPNEYMEGEENIPFMVRKEVFKVRDKEAEEGYREETVALRFTKRGPVISDLLPEMKSDRIITLRWSAAENMSSKLGLTHLLEAHSVKEAREILKDVTMAFHNVTMADIDGNIGWQTLGRIPIRPEGEGMLPKKVVDGKDNWKGYIPYEEMPQSENPEKGWLGNANNRTVSPDFPYYISNHYSPYYRAQRLNELMASKAQFTVDDHWRFQRDDHNVLAKKLAPIFAQYLANNTETEALAAYLGDWNGEEAAQSAATTIYQRVYREVALLTFEDEIGEEIGKAFFDQWYFWQENLEQMILQGESPWFDRINTPNKEDLEQIIIEAGKIAQASLIQELGPDMEQWQWEKAHKQRFVHPLVREGSAQEWVGGVTVSMSGSGETLHRSRYNFDNPQEIEFSAALRMVVDLNDNDKVRAVLCGGQTARMFSKHLSDQLTPYIDGEPRYWWYSDKAIKNHEAYKLVLEQ